MSRRRRWAALLAAIATMSAAAEARAGGLCGPEPPVVEPTAEARAIYDAAQEHRAAGRYAEALEAYQRAYDLSPSYVILFNLGKSAELAGDRARAMIAFECFLQHWGPRVGPGLQADAKAAIAALRPKVGLLALEVDEAGAAVAVDGVRIAKTPLDGPIPVNPGKRLVRVEGTKTESRVIEVSEGERMVLAFDLVDDGPTPSAPGFRFPPGAIGAAWISAGLLGAATAVTGTLAIVGAREIEEETYLGPARTPARGSPLDEKVARTHALATATDVLLTAFLLTGSAAVSFSVVNAVSAKDDPPPVVVGFKGTGVFVAVGWP